MIKTLLNTPSEIFLHTKLLGPSEHCNMIHTSLRQFLKDLMLVETHVK